MSTKRRTRLLLALSLSLCVPLGGCGGSADKKSTISPVGATATRTGQVQLKINWPKQLTAATTRYIPAYASSLYFNLQNKATPALTYTLVVNRPTGSASSQTVKFDQFIPAGTYVLAGVARLNADGQGATVASASLEVDVVPDVVTNVDLALASTIKAIVITGQPLTIPVSSSLQLTGRAVDPDGNTLFISSNALTWSIVSGGEFGTLTSDGRFTATAIGTVRVSYAEAGAGISAQTDISVTAKPQAPQLASSAWPKFHGNLQNTGQGIGSGASGTQKWQFATSAKGTFSSPSIGLDGTVYISGSDGSVYALDGVTGTKKWQFATGGSSVFFLFSPSPAIGSDGTVYTGGLGFIYALEGATGIKKWQFSPGPGYGSSPTIGSDGTVYFGGSDGSIYALDSATGTKKWQFATKGYGSGSSPAIGLDGTIYIAGSDGSNGSVYALDGVTGTKKWQFTTGSGNNFSSPAIGLDGTIYIAGFDSGSGVSVYALDSAAGTKKWQFVTNGGGYGASSPTIGLDGTIYIAGNDGSNGSVYALDGVTGTKKWRFMADGYDLFYSSSPSFGSDGTVYIGGSDGYVYALDGATGTKKWQFATGSSHDPTATVPFDSSSPAIGSDGTIYIGGSDGSVYAIK